MPLDEGRAYIIVMALVLKQGSSVFDLKIGFSTGYIGTTATDFHR